MLPALDLGSLRSPSPTRATRKAPDTANTEHGTANTDRERTPARDRQHGPTLRTFVCTTFEQVSRLELESKYTPDELDELLESGGVEEAISDQIV